MGTSGQLPRLEPGLLDCSCSLSLEQSPAASPQDTPVPVTWGTVSLSLELTQFLPWIPPVPVLETLSLRLPSPAEAPSSWDNAP